MYSKTNKVVC